MGFDRMSYNVRTCHIAGPGKPREDKSDIGHFRQNAPREKYRKMGLTPSAGFDPVFLRV